MAEVEFIVIRTAQGWAIRRGDAVSAFDDEQAAMAEATALAMKAHDGGADAAAIDDTRGERRILWQPDPAMATPHPVWGEGQHTRSGDRGPRPEHLAGQSAKSSEIPTAIDVGRLRTVPPVGHEPPTDRPLASAGPRPAAPPKAR